MSHGDFRRNHILAALNGADRNALLEDAAPVTFPTGHTIQFPGEHLWYVVQIGATDIRTLVSVMSSRYNPVPISPVSRAIVCSGTPDRVADCEHCC